MADIAFGKDGRATFPTKYHGEVTLSQGKWDIICAQPERSYYRFNGEKVATTLVAPDSVRYHRDEHNQFFYYKRFSSININGIEKGHPGGIYFAVIIDAKTGKVCTVYPVARPKPGKAFTQKTSR
jgi:hypothetical protein